MADWAPLGSLLTFAKVDWFYLCLFLVFLPRLPWTSNYKSKRKYSLGSSGVSTLCAITTRCSRAILIKANPSLWPTYREIGTSLTLHLINLYYREWTNCLVIFFFFYLLKVTKWSSLIWLLYPTSYSHPHLRYFQKWGDLKTCLHIGQFVYLNKQETRWKSALFFITANRMETGIPLSINELRIWLADTTHQTMTVSQKLAKWRKIVLKFFSFTISVM